MHKRALRSVWRIGLVYCAVFTTATLIDDIRALALGESVPRSNYALAAVLTALLEVVVMVVRRSGRSQP